MYVYIYIYIHVHQEALLSAKSWEGPRDEATMNAVSVFALCCDLWYVFAETYMYMYIIHYMLLRSWFCIVYEVVKTQVDYANQDLHVTIFGTHYFDLLRYQWLPITFCTLNNVSSNSHCYGNGYQKCVGQALIPTEIT